jgi:nucleoside-diphosphate-sugar epimerase
VRVFLGGASGAVGRPLVPLLVGAGHQVTGMTRSAERAEAIRSSGARSEVVDVFDRDALRRAVGEAAPEVVVHELTSLPERFRPRDERLYDATNRVRAEGTRNLLEAARDAGARRFVCQSVAFSYAPRPSRVHEEQDPLFLDAPAPFAGAVRVLAEMERSVLEADGLEGLVLRYGWFYGPGTYYGAGGATERDVRRRRFPVVGRGSGVFSFIHVDDAAAATVIAAERGAPGAYNIVDDEPAAMSEWLPVYAGAIGAKPPRRVPMWLARLLAGPFVAAMSTTLGGASNAKAKRELGWQPRWASWREGFESAPR